MSCVFIGADPCGRDTAGRMVCMSSLNEDLQPVLKGVGEYVASLKKTLAPLFAELQESTKVARDFQARLAPIFRALEAPLKGLSEAARVFSGREEGLNHDSIIPHQRRFTGDQGPHLAPGGMRIGCPGEKRVLGPWRRFRTVPESSSGPTRLHDIVYCLEPIWHLNQLFPETSCMFVFYSRPLFRLENFCPICLQIHSRPRAPP